MSDMSVNRPSVSPERPAPDSLADRARRHPEGRFEDLMLGAIEREAGVRPTDAESPTVATLRIGSAAPECALATRLAADPEAFHSRRSAESFESNDLVGSAWSEWIRKAAPLDHAGSNQSEGGPGKRVMRHELADMQHGHAAKGNVAGGAWPIDPTFGPHRLGVSDQLTSTAKSLAQSSDLMSAAGAVNRLAAQTSSDKRLPSVAPTAPVEPKLANTTYKPARFAPARSSTVRDARAFALEQKIADLIGLLEQGSPTRTNAQVAIVATDLGARIVVKLQDASVDRSKLREAIVRLLNEHGSVLEDLLVIEGDLTRRSLERDS